MWTVVDTSSGAVVRDNVKDKPTPAAGQEVYQRPKGDYTWSADVRGFLPTSLASVKAQLIAQVKLTNENYVRALYTTNFGKQKKYSRKQQEVMDFRGLAPASTALTSSLSALTAVILPAFVAMGAVAQKKKFRFAMKEAALRRVSVDVVIGKYEQAIETIEDKVANYEAIEQVAIDAINAATTVAAARAAYTAIDWNWSA